jgi:3-dehydroquinate synthase
MKQIKTKDYPIYVTEDTDYYINEYLKTNRNNYSSVFILVDENTLKHCYSKLDSISEAIIIKIRSGEVYKTLETCTYIWNKLSKLGADKKSLLINLGGGVITDIGGFAASTFKRGIHYINIPTTLLAMVDASVGGKTGIDFNDIKNEIGVFNFPEAVFVNYHFLKTLPARQLDSGLAEMIKHTLIHKGGWKKISKLSKTDYDKQALPIIQSIETKEYFVKKDPMEQNIRKALNFGHTIGHALESHFVKKEKKERLLHGEAVAAGMICELLLSIEILDLDEWHTSTLILQLIQDFKPALYKRSEIPAIIRMMRHDKKNTDGIFMFSLLRTIGKCEINIPVEEELIEEVLIKYLELLKLNKK